MSSHRAVRLLAAGLGVVIALGFAATVVAAVLVALGLPAEGRAGARTGAVSVVAGMSWVGGVTPLAYYA